MRYQRFNTFTFSTLTCQLHADFSAVAHDRGLLNPAALPGLTPASAGRRRGAHPHLVLRHRRTDPSALRSRHTASRNFVTGCFTNDVTNLRLRGFHMSVIFCLHSPPRWSGQHGHTHTRTLTGNISSEPTPSARNIPPEAMRAGSAFIATILLTTARTTRRLPEPRR
jgi:hypothetical protein